MSSPKAKRAPDTGVHDAIQSVIKNQKFKRMMVFSLRSLSDLCVPPCVKYKENSLAVLESDTFANLLSASTSYTGDDEIALLLSRIFFGVSEGLRDEPVEKYLVDIAEKAGFSRTVAACVSTGTQDEACLGYYLDTVKNINSLGIQLDHVALAPGFLGALNSRLKPPLVARITAALEEISKNPKAAASLGDLGATDKILNAVSKRDANNADNLRSVTSALNVARNIALAGKSKPNHIDLVISILDSAPNKPTVQSAGSAALGAMVGPDELKICLHVLKAAPQGSPERAAALTTLSCMSYISSCADQIVKAGGVPLLCDAVAHSTKSLIQGQRDAKVIKGLEGACKILGTVGKGSAERDTIVQASGLQILCEAAKHVTSHPTAFAAVCGALLPLVEVDAYASQVSAAGVIPCIVTMMTSPGCLDDALKAGMAVLAAASQHESTARAIVDAGGVQAISKVISHASLKDNLAYKEDAVQALLSLAKAPGTKFLTFGGSVNTISTALLANVESVSVAGPGVELLHVLSQMDGAGTSMRGGASVDLILAAMLAFSVDQPAISNRAREQLEILATEADVDRTIQSLEAAVNGARNNPQKCLKSLAAVNGLSQVAKLTPIVIGKDAASVISKGLAKWIEGSPFTDQQKIIKAGCMCLQQMTERSNETIEKAATQLITVLQLPALKALQDKQGDAFNNSLIDIIQTVESLCATQRIESSDSVGPVVDGILRVMRKYPDSRQTQICCMNALSYIASIKEDMAKKIVESGAIRSVVAYISKVGMYEDVQVSGLNFLHTIAKSGDKQVENLKAADAVSAIQSAARRFPNAPAVKKHCTALMGYLIPDGEVEKLIRDNMRSIDEAIKAGDLGKIKHCFKNINEIVVSAESAKIAARCDLGRSIHNVMTQIAPMRASEDMAPVHQEMAIIAMHMSQKRAGCANLVKWSGVKHIIGMFENLHKKKGYDEGVSACLVTTKRLLQKDRDASEVAFKQNLHTKICLFAQERNDDEKLFADAAGAICAFHPKKAVLAAPEVRRFIGDVCKKLLEDGPKEKKRALIEALDEMLMDPDDEIIKIVMANRGLAGLFKAMEDHTDDLDLVKRAQRCVDNISSKMTAESVIRISALEKQDLREAFTKRPEGPSLETVGRVTRRVLRANKRDSVCCVNALKILNQCTTKADRKFLNELNMMPDIEELMNSYASNPLVVQACGDYLGKLGCDEFIKSYMARIIEGCKKPDVKHIENLNTKLALYLAGEVDDPVQSFGHTQECVDRLAEYAKANGEKPTLLATVMPVTRRLARRFKNDPKSPYGVRALATKMMPFIVDVLSKNGTDPVQRPRKVICDGFITLAECARHPGVHPRVLEECAKHNTIPYCMELLRHHENDPEVVAGILDFLSAVASQPSGAELLATYKSTSKSRRIGQDDVCGEVAALMKRHCKHKDVIENAYELLGNMGKNTKTLSPSLRDPVFVGELESMADGSPVALASMMKCRKKMVGKESRDATAAALNQSVASYAKVLNDDTLADADKLMVAAALADFVEGAADAGLFPELKKAGALDALIDVFDNLPKDMAVLGRVLPALRRAAANDSDASAKIARQGVKGLLGDAGDLIGGDYENSKETLALLAAVAKDEGNGRVIAQTEGFDKFMANVSNMYDSLSPEEAREIKILADLVKKEIEDDQPQVLTLKQVYDKWKTKKDGGEVLDASESQIVIQHFDFVLNYTEEYSKEPHKELTSDLGSEFEAGCKCFELLHELEVNTRLCLERSPENEIFLKAMAKQKNDFVAQCAVLTTAAALQWPEAVMVWAATPNAAAIAGAVLSNGRKIATSNSEREILLIPRMIVVERLAVDRSYFNHTECMAGLIGLWDDYDKGMYSVELLKQVFKSMRKIVNDHWVGILLKNNVPARLIEVVDDKNVRLDLLPDVLFLLAALAVVPEIKTMIGDLKGVEKCLELLARQLKATASSPTSTPGRAATPSTMSAVQTNACLALSAITLGHGSNLNRFVNNKGLELNIQTMNQSMDGTNIEYDVANAASLLMCNTCFKRDEMKELYGKRGACQSVMRTINKYDGSEDPKAFRCLGTMFKAIGNLALFPPNVDIFVDAQIERTFAHLYRKSERLPDNLVEYSLRTLSNLAMENTEANMTRFGICMPPIITMLKQGQRNSVAMFTLAFDVLGALCRLPANSKQFLVEDGIPTCLKILNSYSDVYLYSNGIHVLGIQTTNPNSIPELIRSGVFDFLTSLLESQNNAGDDMNLDLAISGLRCIRRLLKSQAHVRDFIASGGLTQTTRLLTAPNEHSMLHMECHRTILNCLAMFPPPPPPPPAGNRRPVGGEADWEGDVPDEGVLPAIESLDRPPSPRSWEAIELDAEAVSKIIAALSKSLDRDENLKQNRFVRGAIGLLAYFACEKIPSTVDSFYSSKCFSVIARAFELAERDGDLVKVGCYVLNNVAYSSEPELYVTMRKDKELRKQLDHALNTISGSNKAFCDLTLKLLNEKSSDPSRFRIHQQWDFPLELTLWDKDKYPNGVQDLPVEMKEELRTGGKFKTVVGEKDREILHWRSSLDLLLLNWRVHASEGPWQHSSAISRICTISKGLQSDALRKANELGSPTSKPREGECVVLLAPPCEDFPSGLELNVICGSKRSRDRFFDLLNEWREAAAFGF